MSDVFISYSRKDIAFARVLHNALKENDLETWIDWQDIPPSADWLAEVYEAIEQADAFIFIISEMSVISEVCTLEIEHASRHNKRLIPIVINEVDPGSVPPQLAALNWIFFREGDELSKPLQALIAALQVDLEWVKAHTLYLNLALEWDRRDRDKSFLLRGENLIQAETWLASGADKDPPATALHNTFIAVSRKSAVHQQKRILGATLGVLVVSIALGISAWFLRGSAVRDEQARATAEAQALSEANVRATALAAAEADAQARATAQTESEEQRQIAIEQRDNALSRQIASQALENLDQLDLALLLAVEASAVRDSREARSALLEALLHNPQVNRIYHCQDGDNLRSVSFNEAGDTAVNLMEDGTIQHFDWASKTPIGTTLQAPRDDFTDLAVGKNGESLFVWHEAEQVARYDHNAGDWTSLIEDRQDFNGGQADHMALNPVEERIAIARDSSVRVWQTDTMKPIGGNLSYPGWEVTAMAFSPDGLKLAVGYWQDTSEKGVVVFWDPDHGQIVGTPVELDESDEALTHIYYSPNGELLFIGVVSRRSVETVGGTFVHFRVWNTSDQEWVDTGLRLGPLENIDSLSLSPNGKWAATRDGATIRVSVWGEREKFGEESTFEIVPSSGNLTFTPDSKHLVSGGEGCSWYLWDLEERGPVIQHTMENPDSCDRAALSPDGRYLIADCWRSGVAKWEIATGAEIARHEQVIDSDLDASTAIAYNPDGSRVAIGYKNGEFLLMDTNTLAVIRHFDDHDVLSRIYDIAFSPDGKWLLLGSAVYSTEGACVMVFRSDTGEEVTRYGAELASEVLSFTLDPDEDRLYISGRNYERQPVIWRLDGLLAALDVGDDSIPENQLLYTDVGTGHLTISNDGNTLFTTRGQDIYVLDLGTQVQNGLPLQGQAATINALALDPQGYLMASGSTGSSNQKEGYMILLWDYTTRVNLDVPLPVGSTSLVFSSDGTLLANGAEIWEVSLASWQNHACEIANRSLTSQEWAFFMGERPYRPFCSVSP